MKLLASFVVMVLLPASLHAQDSISAARDLYTAASYDEALALLGRLDTPGSQPADRLAINQYRAFCLLALGRTSEAERAIEAVVSAEPMYHPADGVASPRIRTAFAGVRQRILPSIVQQQYAHAKAAFDRQDFPAAAAEFDQVLRALGDPDLNGAASKPPLADLQTLATGFRDLALKAIPPPPPPAPPAPVVAQPQAPVPPRIYGPSDTNVTPPAIVRQDIPPLVRNSVVVVDQGMLEVVISETGSVESAIMRSPVEPRFDAQVLAATQRWKYRPATLDGVPVRYRKFIAISVKP